MDRRRFLQRAAGASLGLLTATELTAMATSTEVGLPGAGLPERWGVQLYTLRSLMQESVPDTLRMLAELGYGEVEFAGYFGWSPRDLRALLDDLGLRAPSAHVPLEQLAADRQGAVFDAALELGHQYLVVPWIGEDRRTPEGYEALAWQLSGTGAAASERGLSVAYHNHDFEFERLPGADDPSTVPTGMELLLRTAEPGLVSFQLDLFWAVHAGHDPVALFAQFPGRFASVHVKDRSASGDMVDVGSGELDFGSMLAAAEAAGVSHAFVEHDNPDDPRASVANAIRHLEGLRG